VDDARAQGQDVTVDNDVHTDFPVSLPWSLPQHLHGKGVAAIVALLQDEQARHKIRREILEDVRPGFGPCGLLKHGRWDRITIFFAKHGRDVVGRTIEAIARERARDPFELYFDLIIENDGAIDAIFDYIDEENIRILLEHPATMISSDGQVLAPYGFLNDPPPYSPCSYGEFPGVLERYVRDEPVLTLEEAVRKMTSFPAQRFGLFDRGVLRPGAWADIVVFDLDRVRDRATCFYPYAQPLENYPHHYPDGIDYVLVGGVEVIDDGQHTGALPGRVLRRQQGM
jgi:N-acyl-D-aspartate/D-glutamate deacylase